jgi:hypothetical protein
MIRDVDNQTEESVHKILPSSGRPVEATLQKLAIEIRKTHAKISNVGIEMAARNSAE